MIVASVVGTGECLPYFWQACTIIPDSNKQGNCMERALVTALHDQAFFRRIVCV